MITALKAQKLIILATSKNPKILCNFYIPVSLLLLVSWLFLLLCIYSILCGIKEFIFLIAKKHHLHFYLVPKDALSNEEIIFGCLSINSMILKYLPEHLKNDKNIVEYAIKQNYNSFEFASDELKGEKQFIKQIVELTPKAIKYASDGIKNLPEFQYLVELTSNKNDFSSDINSSELPF